MNRACFFKNTNSYERRQHASYIRPLKNNFVRMKNSRLTCKMLLILAALISSAYSAYAWTYTGSGPWVSFSFADGYTVYQDGWGSPNDQSQTLYANSAGNWASYVNFTGGGVKCYPHTQKDVDLPINGSYYCNASFNCSASNNGTWYNFMFDCWTANMQDELIISEMWNGDAIWGDVVASNVTIGSTSFKEVRRANNGANNVLVFTPNNKRSSGSEDLMAIFSWSKNMGLLVNNTTLHQVSFGVEVTYTSGWQQFTCNSFSLSFGQNSSSGSGYVSLANRATGLLIDGMGRTANGSNAGQWSSSGSNAQQWTMETSGSNVKFKNRATGLYLDGMGRTSNGSIAGQWSSSSSANQQWVAETYGSYKRIKNAATGLYLDGMSWTTNGSDLAQWSGSGSNAQQWTITSLKSAETSEELSGVETSIQVSPNPSSDGNFILTLSNLKTDNTKLFVYSIEGKKVLEKINLKEGDNYVASGLKKGVYLVKVICNNKTYTKKLIIE